VRSLIRSRMRSTLDRGRRSTHTWIGPSRPAGVVIEEERSAFRVLPLFPPAWQWTLQRLHHSVRSSTTFAARRRFGIYIRHRVFTLLRGVSARLTLCLHLVLLQRARNPQPRLTSVHEHVDGCGSARGGREAAHRQCGRSRKPACRTLHVSCAYASTQSAASMLSNRKTRTSMYDVNRSGATI
jgi:hypothetical protein